MISPLISIIVPVYKVPRSFLERSLASIMAQTLRNIEIIVVDDGSPDDAGMVCDELAKGDARIKVIHRQNGGLSSARNAGVRASNGRYIMFVDGDDWIESSCCEAAFDAAEQNKVQLVMFGMVKDFKNETIPYRYDIRERHLFHREECRRLQKQVLDYNSNIATVTTKLMKREVLIEKNIWHNEDLKQGAEGIVFTFQLFGNIDSAIFVNKPFYHYSYNEESISSAYSEETIEMVLNCFQYIKGRIDCEKNLQLYDVFRTRVLYSVISSVISGFFNPDCDGSYSDRRRKCDAYLNEDIVRDALENSSQDGMSKSRKVILFLIKKRMYFALDCLGVIRKWQKNHK